MGNIWKNKYGITYLIIIAIVILAIIIVILNYNKLLFNSYENEVFLATNNYDSVDENSNEILKYIEASQYRRSYTQIELEQFSQSKLNEYIHIIYSKLVEQKIVITGNFTQNATVIPNTKIGDIFCIEISTDNKKCITLAYTTDIKQIYLYIHLIGKEKVESTNSEIDFEEIKENIKTYVDIKESINFDEIIKKEDKYFLSDHNNKLKVIYDCNLKNIISLQYGFEDIIDK